MVSSILEIYTTGFGWALYNVFFVLFAATGILAYPFLLLVYESWRGGSENSNTMSMGSLGSLQTMKWGLMMKILVFLIAVVPSSPSSLTQLKYERSCDVTGEVATGADITSVNDTSLFGDINRSGAELVSTTPALTKIPALWKFVLAISGGVNSYVVSSIPCLPDLTELDREISNITLDDSEVESQYRQFVSECYVPAKSRFLNRSGKFADSVDTELATASYPIEEHIELDSELFKSVGGLYAACTDTSICGSTLRAKNPVEGIAYSAARDKDYSQEQIDAGVAGTPYCGAWWTSLRTDMADSVVLTKPLRQGAAMQVMKVAEVLADLVPYTDASTSTAELREKYAIRSAVRAAPADFTGMYKSNSSSVAVNLAKQAAVATGGKGDLVAGTAAGALFIGGSLIPGVGDVAEGVASSFASYIASLYVVQKAAPMMQAMILMLIYAFLPIYLVISKYELDAVITGAALIFVVKIMTIVFAVADYLDDALYATMYPDMNMIGSLATQGIDRLVLMAVVLGMYVFAPAFLIYLVAMAGTKVGQAASAGESTNKSIGNTGGAAGGSIARGGTMTMNQNRRKS